MTLETYAAGSHKGSRLPHPASNTRYGNGVTIFGKSPRDDPRFRQSTGFLSRINNPVSAADYCALARKKGVGTTGLILNTTAEQIAFNPQQELPWIMYSILELAKQGLVSKKNVMDIASTSRFVPTNSFLTADCLFAEAMRRLDTSPSIQVMKPRHTVNSTDSAYKLIFTGVDNPGNQEAKVLFFEQGIVVAYKPTGMISEHNETYRGGISAQEYIQEEYKLGSFRLRSRLDIPTSGLLVGYTTDEAKAHLDTLFQTRSIQKVYLGASDTIPSDWKEDQKETYHLTLALPSKGERAVGVVFEKLIKENRSLKLREASTTVTYKGPLPGERGALMEYQIHTGIMHQVRVFAQYMRCPLIGDKVYGGGRGEYRLHSTFLGFALPNGTEVKIASLPSWLSPQQESRCLKGYKKQGCTLFKEAQSYTQLEEG